LVMDFFKREFHGLFAQSWLWMVILLIFASWAARITGLSHWCLALFSFLKDFHIAVSLIYIPTNSVEAFLLLNILTSICCWWCYWW
jgi:hypothetical protein